MPSAEKLTEEILYWLVLDPQAQALAERLLTRFHSMVGDLPASADHHHSGPGGPYRHSIEVGPRALAHQGSSEPIPLSPGLKRHQFGIHAEFVLQRTFAPSNGKIGRALDAESSTAPQVS
jgi:hypothetical protein